MTSPAFDVIIPIGQTCNISFLLQNCKLKKETSLFEWFISKSLTNITTCIQKLHGTNDLKIIKSKTQQNQIYIEDSNIYSGHYTQDEFIPICKRRSERFVHSIRTNRRILFIRFEYPNNHRYSTKDIDTFVESITAINPAAEVTLLLINPNVRELTHSHLITSFYSGDDMNRDPYCKGPAMNTYFVNLLKDIGVQLSDTTDRVFTDLSIL